MNDREFLELAAKAAGIEYSYSHGCGNALELVKPRGFQVYWNPLADDGDALRLAARLRIDMLHTNIHSPQVHALAEESVQACEDSGIDPYAATRRAIVRAAAEIGRAMP